MKLRYITAFILCLSSFLLCLQSSSHAQQGLKISPGDVAEKMIHNKAFVKNARGENFCWNARVNMDDFIDHYQLSKDREWLDAGIQYYDFLISRMDTDPDGYKGWIGPYEYDEKYHKIYKDTVAN